MGVPVSALLARVPEGPNQRHATAGAEGGAEGGAVSTALAPVVEIILAILILAASVMMVALAILMCRLVVSEFTEAREAKKARRRIQPKPKNIE